MDGNEEAAELRIANVRGFVVALQAIKPAKPQDCVVTLRDDGVSFRMEDPSKGLQSRVFLGSELFTLYQLRGGRQVFALPFKSLLDVLQVMQASTASAELTMLFPGPNHDLLLTMSEDGMCTYAGIDTMETEIPRDLTDHWRGPDSHFIAPGALLKEAIDDLEWAAAGGHQSARSAVHLTLRRDPKALMLFAKGAGELKVSFPMDQVDPFHCADRELRAAYKHRHLRAAFCNVQHQKNQPAITTKVTIDSCGMMKVVHMMVIEGLEGSSELPSAQHGDRASEGLAGGKRLTADIQFVVVCEEEDPDDYHVDAG